MSNNSGDCDNDGGGVNGGGGNDCGGGDAIADDADMCLLPVAKIPTGLNRLG